MGIDFRTRRVVFDTFVVLTVAVSSFLTGVFHALQLGDVTTAVVLPNMLLIILAFIHLVLRMGRKYDETVHKKTVELLKTLVFIPFAVSMYMTGLSTEGLMPQSILFTLLSMILLPVSVYILAYRPHQ